MPSDGPLSDSDREAVEAVYRRKRWRDQITAEVYDESRYTPEVRRIMDEHEQRRSLNDCPLCGEDAGTDTRPIGTEHGMRQAHRSCLLREVMGGIGHLVAHDYWCVQRHDPDAGLTYRQSARLVDEFVHIVGVEHAART